MSSPYKLLQLSLITSAILAHSSVSAHTASPYLLPDQFTVKAKTVTAQSAITVEKFYSPSRNFTTDFYLTLPNGTVQPIAKTAEFQRFTQIETDIPSDGTYLIKTGTTGVSTTKYAQVDGRWLRIRPPRPASTEVKPAEAKPAVVATQPPQPPRFIIETEVPVTAPIFEANTIQQAAVYVTKGKPSPIPAITGKGFELKLLNHPNDIFAGDTLKMVALLDGKPIPNLEFDIFKGVSPYDYDSKREHTTITSDKQGFVNITFSDDGLYLLATSYPEAPADSKQKPAKTTYTYGLTLEINE